MRRGGRLALLLGIVIAVIAAAGLYVYIQSSMGTSNTTEGLQAPTAIPTRNVVVARIDIPNNTVLTDTETFLTTKPIPETEYNAAPDDYFTGVGELQNQRTLRQFTFDEPIRASDIGETGLSLQVPTAQPGQPAPKVYTLQVNSLTGVADQIQPGDFVDMVASFNVSVPIVRAGFNDQGQAIPREDTFTGQSTKTLVQNIQVLQIIKPPIAPEGTPTAEAQGSQPNVDENGQPVGNGSTATGSATNAANTLTQGNWQLTIAATDQQIEVIKFSIEQGNGIALVLRGRGDQAVEQTTGVTLELLISQYGLPSPEEVGTPGPQTVPGNAAANNAAAPTATPTP